GAKCAIEERARRFGRQRVPPPRVMRVDRGAARHPVVVHAEPRVLVVVEAGALQLAIVEPEAQRLDQVQLGAGVRCQSNDVAGVGRDLGLNENDRHHGATIQSAPGGSVRATTQFSTRTAPARLSVLASSASEAPVVMTSSITATVNPLRSSSHAKAPRTFFARSLQGSAACGGALRSRCTPPRNSGIRRSRARTRAIS